MTEAWRDDALLLDILIAARKATALASGLDWPQFEGDETKQLAVTRLIQIIGEAARGLSHESRLAHQEIEWAKIIGMRNRLVHDYSRVNLRIVWDVIQNELPVIIDAIEPLVPPPEDN